LEKEEWTQREGENKRRFRKPEEKAGDSGNEGKMGTSGEA